MASPMAPKPGTKFTQTPAQGGKGTAPVVKPGTTTTPIPAQGKGQTPLQPTVLPQTPQASVPAQGGKTPNTLPQAPQASVPAQGGKTPSTVPGQPAYTVGSNLPDGTLLTQEGIDQATALNAAKGQGQPVKPITGLENFYTGSPSVSPSATGLAAALNQPVPKPPVYLAAPPAPMPVNRGLAGLQQQIKSRR